MRGEHAPGQTQAGQEAQGGDESQKSEGGARDRSGRFAARAV